MTKEEARGIAKKIRYNKSKKEINSISKNVLLQIEKDINFINSNNIGIYYPINNEIDLLALLLNKNKNFYFPFVFQNNMCFKKVTDLSEIDFSFRIPQPFENLPNIDKNNLEYIIIPGLAFDLKGYRVGYGKGYFDRYLADFKNFKVGVTLKETVFSNIEFENYDIPVNYVIKGVKM